MDNAAVRPEIELLELEGGKPYRSGGTVTQVEQRTKNSGGASTDCILSFAGADIGSAIKEVVGEDVLQRFTIPSLKQEMTGRGLDDSSSNEGSNSIGEDGKEDKRKKC